MTVFVSLFTPKSRSSPQKIEIDIMKPFEDAANAKRNIMWYDVELSDVTSETDVTHGTIKYKI